MTTTAFEKVERPAPGPPREYRFPRFERRRLGNGIQLVFAPVQKLPVVTVVALIDAGAVCDPATREGLAQLTASLLLEGTERSDGAALIERFERLGASVEAHADWDIAAVTMTVLADRLRPALELLGEVLRTPAFREREVERLKEERIAELLQLRAEPRGLANEAFSRFLYAAESRYARPDGGDERSVRAIEQADVQSFYHARYLPGAVTLIVAGDAAPDAVAAMANEVLGDWRGGTPPELSTSDAAARRSRAVQIVSKADAPQSELRIGQIGIPRNHPDYFAFVVMNAILGGLFSSRINLNLREEHGYTYGAFSGVDWRCQAGPFVVSTAVQSDVTEAAAREVIREIDRMRAEPVAADELSLATSYLAGVFPIRYETTAAIAAALANLVIYRFPDDFYDLYRAAIRSITAEQVLAAAREHLRPDELQLVVVGDASAIRAPLEALQFGPLTVIDTADVGR